MRSQKEILDQIELLRRSGSDPMKVQRKHLIRKLEFKHAKHYLKPEARLDSAVEKNWKETARLDEEWLKREMHDFMYGAYDFYIERDAIGCLVSAQYLIIWLWLLGRKENAMLGHIIKRFTSNNEDYCKPIFDDVCNHFGWNIKAFFQEWEDKKTRLILPNAGQKMDSMMGDIEGVIPQKDGL